MKGKVVFQVLNIVAYLLMVLMNFLANALPINGLNTGEISDMYPNLFAPAGFTFAIWGLIYLALLAFVVFQARDIFRRDKIRMVFLDKIGVFFIISSVLNALWIIAWHYLQIGLSLIIMLLLLLSLVKIYLNLEIGIREYSREENLWVLLPFRIYLGWIVVATIANITAWLVDKDWGGFGISDSVWTVVLIIAAMIINLMFLKHRKDLAVSLVAIWALFGIFVKRSAADPVEGLVVFASIAALAILSLFTLMLALKKIRNMKPKIQSEMHSGN